MKKLYLFLLFALCATGLTNAQLFSDDFESYNVGDYLGVVGGPDWTTWSGTTGGAEDVQITAAQASSGSNGIYFSSSASGGGPQDVVLNFAQQYTSGTFEFESDFYVESGKGGYFNFQGTPVIGTQWAMNCYLDAGLVDIDGFVSGTYTPNTWFTLRIEANLTLGNWEAWVDGTSIGTWANPVNQVASLDLFPTQGNGFYVDDVSYNHTPYVLPQLNGGVSGVDMVGDVDGMVVSPSVDIRNVGVDPITSFDLDITYNGATLTENITGVNIPSLGAYTVDFTNTMTLVAGMNNAMAIIRNVNGMGADGDSNDDTLTLAVNPIVPATGRVVVGEEATGTWCQWCPRGAVYMDIWSKRYGSYFAGIAVHNNDPMADTEYDAGMGLLIQGYPSALVDRGPSIDPTQMGPSIVSNLQTAPAAVIENGAAWNATTRELQVSLTTTFAQTVTGEYKIACVLTEDGVTGTDPAYGQANAYAGGTNGPMGGYENLPATVPASQMVYDHVARAISPFFGGMDNSFPGTMNTNDVFIHNFTYTLPPDWDETKMHIVGMVIAPDGSINNAGYTTVDEAVANGFTVGRDIDGSQVLDGPDNFLKLYPNPTTGQAFATIDLDGAAEVNVHIYDLTDRIVNVTEYGNLVGAQTLRLNTQGLARGIYSVSVIAQGQVFTKKLVIE